jgi:hypothetical protein
MNMQAPYDKVPLDQQIKKTLQDAKVSLICLVFYIFGVVFFPLSSMKAN